MQKKKVKSIIGTVLALTVLIGALVFGLANYNKVDYTVDFTAYLEGPCSFEIVANPSTRILKITAGDEKSKELIKGVSFDGASVSHAINVLTNEMIRAKMLNKDTNLLLALEYSKDSSLPLTYYEQIEADIYSIIKINDANCKLFAVGQKYNEEISALAKENGISVGRAIFVKEIEARNRAHVREVGINTVAKLPLDELCKLY